MTETHVSLFDGSNFAGIALKDKPVFSVQYHPQTPPARPTATDLLARFTELMRRSSKRK